MYERSCVERIVAGPAPAMRSGDRAQLLVHGVEQLVVRPSIAARRLLEQPRDVLDIAHVHTSTLSLAQWDRSPTARLDSV